MERAKVASLKAELSRMRIEKDMGEQALAEKDTALATAES